MSLLITHRCRTDDNTSNYYRIPPQLAFTTSRLKQAIITNNYKNVTGQSLQLDLGDGSSISTIPIEDGRYTADEYAQYLEEYVNAYIPDTNKVKFTFLFRNATQKYYVRCDNNTSNNVNLMPNERMTAFSGIDNLTFSPGSSSLENSNARANINPSFYTIRSRTLAASQMGYGQAAQSDIIGLVPISTDNVSEYQCNDSVFPQVPSNGSYVYNQVDLQFFIEDTYDEVEDPVFAIKLEFR